MSREQAPPVTAAELAQLREHEYRERERERDRALPLHERRQMFLTPEERIEQVEEIHRRAAPGYFPGVSDSTG